MARVNRIWHTANLHFRLVQHYMALGTRPCLLHLIETYNLTLKLARWLTPYATRATITLKGGKSNLQFLIWFYCSIVNIG